MSLQNAPQTQQSGISLSPLTALPRFLFNTCVAFNRPRTQGNGVYTSCCFLPGTTQAITVTSIGEVGDKATILSSLAGQCHGGVRFQAKLSTKVLRFLVAVLSCLELVPSTLGLPQSVLHNYRTTIFLHYCFGCFPDMQDRRLG